MLVTLNTVEMSVLLRQNPATKEDGGYQKLLVTLQEKLDRSSGQLQLSAEDLERIPRYAFNYGNGGWEDRLSRIFARSLGQGLGR